MSWLDAIEDIASEITGQARRVNDVPVLGRVIPDSPMDFLTQNPAMPFISAPYNAYQFARGNMNLGDALFSNVPVLGDIGLGRGRERLGEAMYYGSLGLSHLPGQYGVRPEDIQAFQEGYGDYGPGGRAVWERWAGEHPILAGSYYALDPTDPVNIALMGFGPGTGKAIGSFGRGLAAREGANLLTRGLGTEIAGVGNLMYGAFKAPEMALKGVTYPARRLIKPSATSLYNNTVYRFANAWSENAASNIGVIKPPTLAPHSYPGQSAAGSILTNNAVGAHQRLLQKFRGFWANQGGLGIVPREIAKRGPIATDQDIDDAAQVVASFAQDFWNKNVDDQSFAEMWAINMPHLARQEMLNQYANMRRRYYDRVFQRAAEMSGLQFPSPRWTNIGAIPEVGDEGIAGVLKTPSRQVFAGKGPGRREVISARASAIAQNMFEGGQGRTFAMPDVPFGEAVPEGGTGELFNIAPTNKAGEFNIKTPDRFRSIMGEGVEGPYGLQFGKNINGQWMNGRDATRHLFEAEIGARFSDEAWDKIWELAADYTYYSFVQAAQGTSAPIKNIATEYSIGKMSGPDITDMFNRIYGRKVGAHTEDMFGRVVGEGEKLPTQIMAPSLTRLLDLAAAGEDADELFYRDGAREVIDMIGPANPEQAALLIDLVVATSPQTRPAENTPRGLRMALRALADTVFGFVDRLKDYGLTDWEIAHLPDALNWRTDNYDSFYKGFPQQIIRSHPREVSWAGKSKLGQFRKSFHVESDILDIERDPNLSQADKDILIDAINKGAAMVTSDMWHNRAFGFRDIPNTLDFLISSFRTWEVADALGISAPRAQSLLWFGAKRRAKDIGGASMGGWLKEAKAALAEQGITEDQYMNILAREAREYIIRNDPEIGWSNPGPMTIGRISAIKKFLEQKLLPQIESGESYGATFDFIDPGKKLTKAQTVEKGSGLLQNMEQRDGWWVGLAGSDLIPLTERSRILSEVDNVLNKFSPSIQSALGDKLKLGIYKNDAGMVSLDLSTFIKDEEIATRLARQLNQESIYNPAKIGEDGTPGFTKEIFTPEEKELMGDKIGHSPLKTADDLTGKLHEIDMLVNNSGFRAPQGLGFIDKQSEFLYSKMKKFADKLFGAYMDESQEIMKGKIPSGRREQLEQMKPEDIIGTLMEPKDLINPNISDVANRTLGEKFTKGAEAGRSFYDVAREYEARVQKGLDALNRSNIKFDDAADLKARQSLIDDKDAKWLLGEMDKYGLTHENLRPQSLTMEHMQRLFANETGAEIDKMGRYKTIQAAWGQQALISPRYHLANVLGSWMQMIMSGHNPLGSMSPNQYWKAIQAQLKNEGTNLSADNLGNMKVAERLKHWGIISMPKQIARTQSVEGQVGTSSKNSLGKVAKRIIGEKAGGFVGKVGNVNQAVAAAWEINVRSSMFTDIMDREMSDYMVTLNKDMMDIGRKHGVDLSEVVDWETGRGFVANEENALSIPGMKKKLIDAGLPGGQAERITRNFMNMRSKAMENAIKEVNRVHFSYDFTNLDEAISKIVPFHYWASRATRFYAEEAIRHPIYLYKYAQMREGIEKVQNDPGLSARSKGFVKLLDSPYGFSLLMNPEGLLGVIKVFDLDSGLTPEGETELGKLIRIGKSHGVGIFPWIDATLNYMGVYGDTFAPDPIGLRTRQLIGGTVNYARANLGMEPAPAPYEGANVKMRDWISSINESLTGGWLGERVRPKASEDGTLARATLDDIITSRIMAENPNITNSELLEILNDPDSPEYDKAYKDAASAGLLQQVLNFTLPTTFKVREASRDVARAQLNEIRSAAKEAGVSPDEFTPSMADANFYTTYKNKTGRDYVPGDFNKAQLKRDLAVAPPAARPFIIQESEYHALGSKEGQRLLDKANDIRSGKWTPTELAGMRFTPEERDMVADVWLSRNDPGGEVTKLRELQAIYRDTHPEFDTFKSWQGQMFNLRASYGDSGWAQYRQLVSQNNPNAARYFKNKLDEIRRYSPGATPAQIQEQLDSATISPASWMAVTGQVASQFEAAPLPTGNYPYDPATAGALASNDYQMFGQPQLQQQSPYSKPTGWLGVLANY